MQGYRGVRCSPPRDRKLSATTPIITSTKSASWSVQSHRSEADRSTHRSQERPAEDSIVIARVLYLIYKCCHQPAKCIADGRIDRYGLEKSLSCSAVLEGEYGYKGISMGVPVVLGKEGISTNHSIGFVSR